MKVVLLISAFSAFSVQLVHGQSEYVYPDFKKLAKTHQEIAILPWKFSTKLRDEDAAKLTSDQIHEMQIQDGLAFQKDVYDYFIKKDIKVKVQDIEETNRILAENGIDGNNIGDYKHNLLAEMLNVDAMVSGNFKTSQPLSDEVAQAIAVLTLGGSIGGMKGHEATGVMRITDRQGTQMWRYSIHKTSSNGEAIVKSIMKKSARNIPYM